MNCYLFGYPSRKKGTIANGLLPFRSPFIEKGNDPGQVLLKGTFFVKKLSPFRLEVIHEEGDSMYSSCINQITRGKTNNLRPFLGSRIAYDKCESLLYKCELNYQTLRLELKFETLFL